MRNVLPYKKIAAIISLLLAAVNTLLAQQEVKAKNQNCALYLSTRDTFTWSGDCTHGYCSGFGTIQFYKARFPMEKYVGTLQDGQMNGFGYWYYANGIKKFDGYYKDNLRNGFGTSYYEGGTIHYRGYWADNEPKNKERLDATAKAITEYMVGNVFEGGKIISSSLAQVVYGTDGSLQVLGVKMEFNGRQATKMKYLGTIMIRLHPLAANFVDANENFAGYAYLKPDKKLLAAIKQLIDKYQP